MVTGIECAALPIMGSGDVTRSTLSIGGLPSIHIFGYGLLALVLLAISACDSGGSSTSTNQSSTQAANLAGAQVAQLDGSLMASAVEEATSDTPCEAHPLQVASGVEASASPTDDVTCLFGAVAPMPSALAISYDGQTASHIGTNSDVAVWNTADFKLLETIPSGGKKPSSVALSPDGNLLAIGYFDSRVIVRSRRENKILREFKGHAGGVSALAFSLDGQLLASGGDDATSQIWELSTGRQLRVFDSEFGGSDHGGLVVSLGFSGNGRALVVNEWYSRFYDVGRGTTLWDIEKGIEISTRGVAPPNSDNTMRAGQALGGRGWLLAYTGPEGLMAERLDGCEAPRKLPSGGYAETVSVDPQGRWIAAAVEENLMFFGMNEDAKDYSVTLPSKAITLVAHPDGHSVYALAIKKTRLNGNEHFIGGRDAETVTGSAIYRLTVPSELGNLPALVVKKNATHCAPTAAAIFKQNFYLPDKPTELKVVANLVPTSEMKDNNPPRELYFAKDGSLYALHYPAQDSYNESEHSKNGVAVWNIQTQRLLHSWFSQDVGRSSNNAIRLRDGWGEVEKTVTNLLTGKPFSSLSNDDDKNHYVNVTSDRDTGEVYRPVAGHFERYDATGKRLNDLNISGNVATFAARNGRLAAVLSDGKIQVWPLQTGGESKTYTGLKLGDGNWPEDLALSADGHYLRIAFPNASGDGPTVYVTYRLGAATLKPIGNGALLAPFPDRANRGVVRDKRPHHLAVWDFDKGEIIARLPRHPSRDMNGEYQLLIVAMSDDGRFLASASFDGLVRVWDLTARKIVGEANLGGEKVMEALANRQKVLERGLDGVVRVMAFDPDSGKLAVGKWDGQLVVLQIPNTK